MRKICVTTWMSPVGEMILGSIDHKICLCDWVEQPHRQRVDKLLCQRLDAVYSFSDSLIVSMLIKELEEYFSGHRTIFDSPYEFAGTSFQLSVWTELAKISYGSTISYADLARRIGNPNAVRAVANAVAANPMSIIVPCHRVVGSNNSLTGYAGGLKVKRALLDLELGLRFG